MRPLRSQHKCENTFKYISKNYGTEVWTRLVQDGNETSGSIKGIKFLSQKGSVPRCS